MASSLCRTGYNVFKRALFSNIRPLSLSATCNCKSKNEEVPGVVEYEDESISIIQGSEKFDSVARSIGIEDPYEPTIKSQNLELGTFDAPNLVPSTEQYRVVGCLCDEDAVALKFIVLHKGEQKQCDCGKWFKLIPVKLEDVE